MPKVFKFTAEQENEVARALKLEESARLARKLQVIDLRIRGYRNTEIAEITRYSKERVVALIGIYAKEGLAYFLQENRRGGRHRNMSNDGERALISQYEAEILLGDLTGLKAAYERGIGREANIYQIHHVLERHGWQKIKRPYKAASKLRDKTGADVKQPRYVWGKKDSAYTSDKTA